MAKQKRINNLSSISGLTAQMRAVYRLARQNLNDSDVGPQEAKTLTDILKTIVQAQRDNELEQRITELEKRYAEKES